MYFEILGDITNVETFAIGSSIREIARLRKMYGRGRWGKRKGIARVRLEDGEERLAELHGTKPTESDVNRSRLSAILTNGHTLDPQTIRRLPKEQGV
jgi:hypothetical protein